MQRPRSKSVVHSEKHKLFWDCQRVVDEGVTKREHESSPEVDARTENALQPEDNGTLQEGSKQGKNLVKFYYNNTNNIYHLSSTYISQ